MTVNEISEVSDFLLPAFPTRALSDFYEQLQLGGLEMCRCIITDFTDFTDWAAFGLILSADFGRE